MGTCPECKKEITQLWCKSVCYQEYDDKGWYGAVEDIGETIEYTCPECGKKVCETESEADKILSKKGE